jgi:hypothetical protein
MAIKKTPDNSFGVYTGVSFYQNTKPFNLNYTLNVVNTLKEPQVYFKHKKHQFMAGPTIVSPLVYNKNFVPGGTFSYLYHFGYKRVHLFAEANIKGLWYSDNAAGNIAPYHQPAPYYGGDISDGKLRVLTLHAMLGVEIKTFNFLCIQLAFGPGYYFIHAKPGHQATYPDNNDSFSLSIKDNIYKNPTGLDLYGRIGLAWRLYGF